jgi:hypothetical protein
LAAEKEGGAEEKNTQPLPNTQEKEKSLRETQEESYQQRKERLNSLKLRLDSRKRASSL